MKNIIFILFTVCIMISCGYNPTSNSKKNDIQIFKIEPTEGYSGSTVRIIGKNFGNDPKIGNILLNDLRLKIITWGDTTINCGIVPNSKSGKMKVVLDTNSSNGFDFIVKTRPETVLINNINWTTSNLDVANYRNGDIIPQITNPNEWSKLTTGAWCYYNNDTVLGKYYGKLYNWYAVNDPRGLAPAGYRIPSLTEWTNMIYSLGGFNDAGGKLKEKNTWLWKYPNEMATNESGFSALGGGMRQQSGTFGLVEQEGSFWTSTIDTDPGARFCSVNYLNGKIVRDQQNRKVGYYIRCVKE